MILQPSRRGFLTGLGALIAAPAIVRAGSLMPVKKLMWPGKFVIIDYVGGDPVELDVLYGQIKIGSALRIRLPNDYMVCNAQA